MSFLARQSLVVILIRSMTASGSSTNFFLGGGGGGGGGICPKCPILDPPLDIAIMHPVVALILAWVIDRPVQAITLIQVAYILAVTQGIRALRVLKQSGIHSYQVKPECPCHHLCLKS